MSYIGDYDEQPANSDDITFVAVNENGDVRLVPVGKAARVLSVTSFPSDPHRGMEVWRSDEEAFFKFDGADWYEI